MRIPYLLLLFLPALGCAAAQLEEVTMHEVVFKPYKSSSFVTSVGGALGDVRVSLARDNSQDVLSTLSIRYGDAATAKLESEIVSCIPAPVIEAAMFYYTELGTRTTVPDDWFSSVLIPFSADDSDGEPSTGDSMVIPLYPAIEFEFVGYKLSRIKVRKSSEDVRVTKDLNEGCPKKLIDWAVAKKPAA